MLSACVRSSGGKRELALNYGAGDGRMDCEDGRHLFMIGWMDVLVDRIARQFHLKRTSRVEEKLHIGAQNNTCTAHTSWNRRPRPKDGRPRVSTICQAMTQLAHVLPVATQDGSYRWINRAFGVFTWPLSHLVCVCFFTLLPDTQTQHWPPLYGKFRRVARPDRIVVSGRDGAVRRTITSIERGQNIWACTHPPVLRALAGQQQRQALRYIKEGPSSSSPNVHSCRSRSSVSLDPSTFSSCFFFFFFLLFCVCVCAFQTPPEAGSGCCHRVQPNSSLGHVAL